MLLVQKWPFLKTLFFFRQYRPGKCLLQYSRTKKRLSRLKKQEVQTVEKLTFFTRGPTHAFGTKMAIFPTFFFPAIQPRKMSFAIFQNEKTPLQAIKTKSSKNHKIEIFPNGLTHAFGKKNGHISKLIFQTIQARKMSFTIFQNEKTPFQAIKTRRSNSRKIGIFPKGITHAFGTKMAIFPTLFFSRYTQGKCL